MKLPDIHALKKNYPFEIEKILRPTKRSKYVALDIYSGAGGLSLGLEAAGFKTTGIDCNPDCCDTYNSNLRKMHKRVHDAKSKAIRIISTE